VRHCRFRIAHALEYIAAQMGEINAKLTIPPRWEGGELFAA
jgi:hypothetical protein